MNRTVSILLAVALVEIARADSTDAQTILKRASAAYSTLKSYEIQATNVMQSSNADFEQTMKSKLIIAAEQPGKFRVEAKGMGGMTMVSNGSETWTYNSYLKQYTKTAAGQSITAALASGPGNPMLPEHAGQSVKAAQLMADEDVTINGSVHPCYVLEVEFGHKAPMAFKSQERPSRIWIDKSTYLVLKRISEVHAENMPPTGATTDIKTTITVDSLKVNEPPAPELFSFTPPATAKLVDSFEFPGMKKSDLVGKQAADFNLTNLHGEQYQLQRFRGKVVLLDFWATWCAPCRAEMPVLEKIHQDNKDVVVLGIDVGEDADVVQKFIAENKVTYPILVAGHDHVVDQYNAHALPTVVIIDQNGTIRNYKTGFGTETEPQLRAAVSDASKPGQVAATPSPKVPSGLGPGAGSESGSGVFKIGGGVSAPVVLYKVEPVYTEEARKAHVSGAVVLSVVVSADGTPGDIRLIRSLGYGLDERAAETVKTWRFRPGLKDGKPVPVECKIEVNFRLLDGASPAMIGSIPSVAPPPVMPAFMGSDPESEPATAEEAYRRGTHLLRTRRLDEGIAMLTKAIALRPDWPQAVIARARAQYQQKRYNDAIKDFDEAIRLDPKNASWYDGRGLAYSYSGRHARAVEDYTRAIELNPTASPLPYNNRGWAYTELGQPEKAIADLTKAIQIAPDYPKAYENRALAYTRLENWNQAIADYTAGIQLNPTRWLYEKRAEAKRAAGNPEGANEDVRMAAQMPAPQSTPSQ